MKTTKDILQQNQQSSNIANRLDRLPISKVHYYVLFALGIVYFFDLADLFTLSTAAPALIDQWGLNLKTIGHVTSISFLGMFVGASVGGWIADKIGRKKALSFFVFIFSIASALTAISWNVPSLMVFRLITGVGIAAAMVITNSYLAEFFPSHVRGKFISYCAMLGLVGVPITNIVSAFVIPLGSWGWRLVFLWGAVGLIYFIFARKLEESPRWYENRGDYEKADAIMCRIEDKVRQQRGELPPASLAIKTTTKEKANYLGLFKGRNLKITIILSCIWILETFGFYGFASWVPSLLKSSGISTESTLWYTVVNSIGAPFGAFIGSIISEKFQRKNILAFSALLTAISGLLYGMTFIPIMIIVFGLIVNVTQRIFTSNLYAYTSEPYATAYRSSGSGLSYGIGRFSNIFGSLLIGSLAMNLGYTSVFIFIGGCWLVCAAILTFIAPKTNSIQV